MRSEACAGLTTASVLVVFLAVAPASAAAQEMAASFDELVRVLRVGEVIYVTDKAGVTTWGQVDQLSESSMTVRVMSRDAEKAATLISAERRVFTRATAGEITRSDASGAWLTAVYPPSWDRIGALPHNAPVTVTLDTGERQTFRFAGLDGETLRVSEGSGKQLALPVARVRRILRRQVDDPTINGVLMGALAGAGTMLGVTAAMYARCDAGCEAPAYREMYPVSMGLGAAVGAAAGWIIDRLHNGTDQVFPAPRPRARVGLAPVFAPTPRGVAVSIAF